MNQTVYDFQAHLISGEECSLNQYQGKVLLIVNTASLCGFTPQLEGLQKLYLAYKEQGLEILGFPCNQFKNQDPKTDAEIKEFCEARFQITFPLFGKVVVNGPDAHPLFQFLKKAQPGVLGSEKIKWNFTKFLVNQKGIPVQRFAPLTKPESLVKPIQELL